MHWSGIAGWLEPALGSLLLAIALLDVFFTVLYARAGSGILSPRLAHLLWRLFRSAAKGLGRHEALTLSLCGPAILVALLVMWTLLLALGAALVIHPALGTAVQASSGPSETDLITALFVGGGSMSIVGSSDYGPQTPGFKLFFLFASLAGMSVVSLTLTYLMQVYNALRSRNVTGLFVHVQTAETGDAAELVAGWGPKGQFSGGYNNLSTLASELSGVKESHHFYPVLFYFRFRDTFYSVSRMTLVSLDAVALIRTGLADEHGWLKEAAGVNQLQRTCAMLLATLTETFLPDARHEQPDADARTRETWRRRYHRGLARLRQAGIATRKDEQADADEYLLLRAQWEHQIRALAPMMAFRMEEVDPAAHAADRAAPPPDP